MNIDEFAARRQATWHELEATVDRVDGSVRRMPSRDLERFGMLYRRASSDLAIANRDFPHDHLTLYLNGLCGRAHTMLYMGHGGGGAVLLHIAQFYRSGFPRAFRSSRRYMIASSALLIIGVAAGWLAVVLRPDLAPSLLPNSLFDQMARGRIGAQLDDPVFTSFGILTNNIKVALVCFAFGIALGVPTAVMLMANGWMLGTLAAAIHQGGYDLAFWSLILPHGVMEMSIIVFAGGAGLMMGTSILRPGLSTRLDALHQAAVTAMFIALGAASLLPVCGFIEGFISPSALPRWFKFTVALVTGVALYSWLLLGGRSRAAARSAATPALGDSWHGVLA